MQKKKGISLIVLVITIIVMIILAGAIIVTLNNTGIIGKSSEAVFKQNVRNYQSELELYLAERLTENPKFNITTVNATSETTPSIKDLIKSISDKDLIKFEVAAGKLKYVGNDELELKWCEELGLKTKNTPMTEAEYNALYAEGITLALQYGEVVDGVYRIKDEYYNEGWNASTFPTSISAEYIAIPYGVTKIHYATFVEVNKIKDIILPNTLKIIEDNAFLGSGFETIDLPDSLTTFGYGTFISSGIKTITIPGSVNSIGGACFAGSQNLEKVVISDNVEIIEQSAFNGTIIKEIHLPKSIKTIADSAFGGASIETIYYGGSKEDWLTMNIGDNNDGLFNSKNIIFLGETEEAEEYAGLTVTADTEGVKYFTVEVIYPNEENGYSEPQNQYTQVTDTVTIARMQATPQKGDCITYKGAEYVYGYSWGGGMPFFGMENSTWNITQVSTELCGNIFGRNVTNMDFTCEKTDNHDGSAFLPSGMVNLKIPNTIISMMGTFMELRDRTFNITIPSSVKNIDTLIGLGYDGGSIDGIIEINANPTSYGGCFGGADISKLVITGDSELLDEIKATAN